MYRRCCTRHLGMQRKIKKKVSSKETHAARRGSRKLGLNVSTYPADTNLSKYNSTFAIILIIQTT